MAKLLDCNLLTLKFFIFLLCLLSNYASYSQFDFDLASGTHHASIGRASVSASGIDAIFNNPAGLAETSGVLFNLNALRRYNIAGLDYYSAGISYCTNHNAFSFRLMQKGLDDFRETGFGFSYARYISQKISIGSSFNYNHLSQLEFDKSGYFTFDIGVLSKISEKVVLGLKITNPTNRKIDDYNTILSGIRFGSRFMISNELILFTEIQKNTGLNPDLKFGVDYKVINNFNLLLGVIPSNSEFTFGFGYIFNNSMGLTGAFLYDQRIDVSPAFGISYNANRK